MVKDTDFKATVDTIGKDKIVNSSIASLKKTDGATQIEAAYLVWETSVQGKNNTDLVKRLRIKRFILPVQQTRVLLQRK